MTKPAVVLIGADKGGVGKTTVARTLLDYFAHHRVRARAFDTEVPRGTLKRFHPNVTDVVDINYVPDQMRIFDTVNSTDATVSLIDVRAGLLSPTLLALRNIGFIEAAKKGEITFVVFHILGPSIASLDEIAETAAYLGDAKYFMVKNSINNAHFFEWDEATQRAYFKTVPRAVEITVSVVGGADLHQVTELLKTTAANLPAVAKEPAPQVYVAGFAGGAVTFQVRVWTDRYQDWAQLRSDLSMWVNGALVREKIAMA